MSGYRNKNIIIFYTILIVVSVITGFIGINIGNSIREKQQEIEYLQLSLNQKVKGWDACSKELVKLKYSVILKGVNK